MPIRRATIRSLAKINLDLRVLHQRPDGFHELRTVFQTISLADTIDIEYEPARRTAISIDDHPATVSSPGTDPPAARHRIAELTGLDVHTIAKGRRELFERDQQVGRIRRPGGGRKAVEKKRPRSSPRSKP